MLLYRIVTGFGEPVHIQYNATLLLQPFMAVFLLVSVLAMGVVSIAFHQKAAPKLITVMTIIGKYSYGAYLAHALMLTLSTSVADALLPGWNVSLRTAAAFAVCSLLSIFAAMLLAKFSIGRLFIGAPAPRKS
jgi:membrane-bound acyltransferase YfiQ involved in biofilm formation